MSINNRLINTGGGGLAAGYYGVRYTGTGSTQDITGFGFKPDIIWVKANYTVANHTITTIQDNFTQTLSPNNPNPYATISGSAIAIDDGIRVGGSDIRYNQSGIVYDVFAWKAGDSFVANTNGSTTSQVCANVDAGVSIVTWSGNGVNGHTIGHGLSQSPDMVIVKSTTRSSDWTISSQNTIGLYKYLKWQYASLNVQTDSFAIKQMTNTTIALGTSSQFNENGHDYMAFVFHSVDGYSKMGTFEGVNTTNGVTIPTTFAPKYFMGKTMTGSKPFYMQNKYMNQGGSFNYFYKLSDNYAVTRNPGLEMGADYFRTYLYFDNSFSSGTIFYATFADTND